MLKKSYYNIMREKENGYLYYNAITGALGIMKPEVHEFINQSDSIDYNSIGESELKGQIDLLRRNGFLVPSHIDERERDNFFSKMIKYNMNNLHLTIAPTLDCNMDCEYCFESNKGSYLEEDTHKKLITYIKNSIVQNGAKSLTIHWFGGEPLLCLEYMEKFSEEMIAFCKEKNVKYYSGIITNGTLLSVDVAKVLSEKMRVRFVQITIDGVAEIHNSRRKLKNNADSFSLIMKNVEMALEHLKVVIRVNVDKENMANMRNLIDCLENYHWINKVDYYFANVEDYSEGCSLTRHKCFTYKDFIDFRATLTKYKHEKNNLTEAGPPPKMPLACGQMHVNSFTIDPEGDLYKCWSLIGQKEHSVGNIFSGVDFSDNYFKWENYKLPEFCNDCKYKPNCQGGCPMKGLIYDEPQVCTLGKLTTDYNIDLIYELYKKDQLLLKKF